MAAPSDGVLEAVQEALGHRFDDLELLRSALTHRSFLAEQGDGISYERLEFLGDAVLQLAVTDYLYATHPALSEGAMAKVRAAVVNEPTLARVAERFGLADGLFLGHGEELTGGRSKASILADVVESALGAVYLEAGYERARDLILTHWTDLVDARATSPGRRDYKTRLQERLARSGQRPEYRVSAEGPEHAKLFTAGVYVDGRLLGTGTGTSKKRAEQAAAQEADERLDADAADA